MTPRAQAFLALGPEAGERVADALQAWWEQRGAALATAVVPQLPTDLDLCSSGREALAPLKLLELCYAGRAAAVLQTDQARQRVTAASGDAFAALVAADLRHEAHAVIAFADPRQAGPWVQPLQDLYDAARAAIRGALAAEGVQ